MMHSAPDPFQPGAQGQPHLAQARLNQMQRHSMYNPQVAGIGYRGTPQLQMSPYGFQPAAQPRPNLRANANPAYRHSMGPTVGYQYHDSSASSTASSSTSSNRSLAGRYAVSKDDSVLGIKPSHALGDTRSSTARIASFSTPDLSMGSFEAPRMPAQRYHRLSRQFDAGPPSPQLPQSAQQSPTRPALQQASSSQARPRSAEGSPELQARQGSPEDTTNRVQNSRYKRRSVVKPDSSPVVGPVPFNANSSAPTWSQVVSGVHNMQYPLPPPSMPIQRPGHQIRSSSTDSSTLHRPSSVSLVLKPWFL
jgi:hypothetical protein